MRNADAMLRPPGRVDWETPASVFDPLHAEFGFTVDAAADAGNAKVPRYWTEADDGLAQPWAGESVWVNPPYGNVIAEWVAKAHRESVNATVVMLVPARTDTRWWHKHVEGVAEVRFVKGRIRFVGAPYNAPFPCALLVYRPSPVPPKEERDGNP